MTFCETLKKAGWEFRRDDNITEGVTVLASLKSKYLAFDVGDSRCCRVCLRRAPLYHAECADCGA